MGLTSDLLCLHPSRDMHLSAIFQESGEAFDQGGSLQTQLFGSGKMVPHLTASLSCRETYKAVYTWMMKTSLNYVHHVGVLAGVLTHFFLFLPCGVLISHSTPL